MIQTVKKIEDIDNLGVLQGYLVNSIKYVPIAESNRDYREIQEWINSETIIGIPASEDYTPQVGQPSDIDYTPQIGTPASEDYEIIPHILGEAYTALEIAIYQQKTIEMASVTLIDKTIQNEIMSYNVANNIALASVHNAESYSRVSGYTHADFCGQVWLWSVSLWEHMRAWQGTLVTLPTILEVQAKIDELPFVMV